MTTSQKSSPWDADQLNRKSDSASVIEFLCRWMKNRCDSHGHAAYTLNIDAQWGQGKSFFLAGVAHDLKEQGHLVATVNAWESDISGDALVAIVAAIEDAIHPHLSRSIPQSVWKGLKQSAAPIAVLAAKGMASAALRRVVGDAAEQIQDLVFDSPLPPKPEDQGESSGDTIFDAATSDAIIESLMKAYREQQASISSFRERLSNAAQQYRKDHPDKYIFVLVDELDRCKPSYSVSLLETVKHLFDTDGVVFIIASDTTQLCASIKAVYGSEFDAKRYLLRFFNRTYTLRTADQSDRIKSMFVSHGIDYRNMNRGDIDAIHITDLYFRAFNLSLRDQERCFDIFSNVHSIWPYKIGIQLILMWPIIITHYSRDLEKLDLVSNKKSSISRTQLFNNDLIAASYVGRDYTGGGTTNREVKLIDLLSSFIAVSHRTFQQHHNLEAPSGFSDRLAHGYIRDELILQHDNKFPMSGQTFSVLREYRAYVDLAVQFTEVLPSGI